MTVLDPFCGSGTTCVVALKHGRKYVGIDINTEYCELAKKRLQFLNSLNAQKNIREFIKLSH